MADSRQVYSAASRLVKREMRTDGRPGICNIMSPSMRYRKDRPMPHSGNPAKMINRREFLKTGAAALASLTRSFRAGSSAARLSGPERHPDQSRHRRGRHGTGPPGLPRRRASSRLRCRQQAPGPGPGDRRPRRLRLPGFFGRSWPAPISTLSTSPPPPLARPDLDRRRPGGERTSGARSR